VMVETGYRQIKQSWTFQRLWVKVHLIDSNNTWYPSRLLIGSHGKNLEIGHFLTQQEKQDLARDLKHAI